VKASNCDIAGVTQLDVQHYGLYDGITSGGTAALANVFTTMSSSTDKPLSGRVAAHRQEILPLEFLPKPTTAKQCT